MKEQQMEGLLLCRKGGEYTDESVSSELAEGIKLSRVVILPIPSLFIFLIMASSVKQLLAV
jgi:hypothetical protein